jgi:putative transposase
MNDVWDIFTNQLYFLHHGFDVSIKAFVLMSNHFHAIISTPHKNLSESMNYFLTQVSRQITFDSGRINQTFGAPYHASLLKTNAHYLHAYKYVYRNPVEAGLSRTTLHYPYSSLAGLIGFRPLHIPIEADDLLLKNTEDTIRWLETGYPQGHREAIEKALRKKVYAIGKDRSTRKDHELESSRS